MRGRVGVGSAGAGPGTAARLDRGSYPAARPKLGFTQGKKGEGKMGQLQLSVQSNLGKIGILF
jgi:hypothetical protein